MKKRHLGWLLATALLLGGCGGQAEPEAGGLPAVTTINTTGTPEPAVLAEVPIHFSFELVNAKDLPDFLKGFDGYVTFDFTEIMIDFEPREALVIWTDTDLADLIYVEGSLDWTQPDSDFMIERELFSTPLLPKNQPLVIESWLDLSGAYYRNGLLFTDELGRERQFLFGLNNADTGPALLFFEY